MTPGICHDIHTGIKTLKVRKLIERILNIRRMLHLKEAIGHYHLAAQRIRLKPHNVYRAAPIHKFLIGEWHHLGIGNLSQYLLRGKQADATGIQILNDDKQMTDVWRLPAIARWEKSQGKLPQKVTQ